MKKSKLWTILCVVLVVVFLAGCLSIFAACDKKDDGTSDNPEQTTEITVTFYDGDTKLQEVKVDANFKMPANPTKDGYTFAGWYTDKDNLSVAFDSKNITANINVYAKWTENGTVDPQPGETDITVTFYDGDTKLQEVKVDADFALPANPTKEGYDFVGWYTDADLTEAFVAGEITENISVYAKWEKQAIVVTFVNEDADYASVEYTEGEALAMPTTPTRYSHEFKGWYTADGEVFDANNITASVTVYAKWALVRSEGTLVVAYSNFSEKFSPFFATSSYDVDVYALTQASLLASDRGGNIIYNGIEGETITYNGTPYTYYGISNLVVTQNGDGTVDYTITMRDDIVFSDGTPMTVKDVIFTMYAFSDTDYDGSTTFYSLPIVGMDEWRTNLKSDVLAKWTGISNAVLATFDEEAKDYVYVESASYTEDQFNSLVGAINSDGWTELANDIIAYVAAKYAAYATPGNNNEVGMGMEVWGFGSFEDGVLTDSNDKTYNYANGEYPTVNDYVDCLKAAYKNNLFAAAGKEKASGDYDTYVSNVTQKWIADNGKEEMNGENVNSISGITFNEETNTINVRTSEFSATTVYQLSLAIAPMHYYGSTSLWDPANGSYGFTRGNLNALREKTTRPMGAGPYKFVNYQGGIVTFEANSRYWEGTPKINNIMFKEYSKDEDKLPAVISGEVDIATPSISDEVVSLIKETNGSDELAVKDSLKVSTDLVDFNGYGYIGMNADNIKVGDDKGSEASKNLRKAFATLFASYREYTVNSYYRERASVIQYPISNCSWAAPQPADEGYDVAFSKDVNGNKIYNADMTEEQRWAAAKEAAIGFFKAAGYNWDGSKFTSAPAGAKMSYEAIIGGGGTGDHPTMNLLIKCKEVLATIGIELVISDQSSSATLFAKMEGGTAEIFIAAWGGSSDPDMYQVYHSSNTTNSNHYRIADTELDENIINARKSANNSYRKAIYKDCLDIILDWAVEIPVYQRKDCTVYNSSAIKLDTLTPDTTPYWSYLAEIYKLETK